MARPLLRCSSLKAHLKEKVFTDPTASPSPVVFFNSKPTRKKVQPVTEFVSKFDSLVQSDDISTGFDVLSASISSIFPTHKDVQDAQDMISSTGATTVIGVGSGIAMDLVKALEVENKFLIPGTSAAVFAANTPYSLILDLEKEVLVTKKSSSKFTSAAETGTIIPNPDTVTACHSILLDASYRDPYRVPDLELAKWALAFDPLIQGMISTSLHVDEGEESAGENKGMAIRSAPLALAASLVPAFFPRASLFSFWASLLPGLASLHNKNIFRDRFPHLADLAAGPVSVETLMGHVQRNQEVSNGVTDLAMMELEQILTVSLRKDLNTD